MTIKVLKSYVALFLTASIWGFAFVAQRVGMQHIGPFTYNSIRFMLGAVSLLPLIIYRNKTKQIKVERTVIKPGIIVGIFLFLGSTLQQIGLIGTTSGKAAFLTGLYIILVPIIGILIKRSIGINTWLGGALALIGLYALCLADNLSLSIYDLLEIIGAVCFAIHILIIEYFVRKNEALVLSAVQFVTCSILSTIVALAIESITISSIVSAGIPILYGGIFSVGIAYTLQVIGQKNIPSTNAAIILSMESVFATLGGIILLHEPFGMRELVGCALMFSGMILAQIQVKEVKKKSE